MIFKIKSTEMNKTNLRFPSLTEFLIKFDFDNLK